MTAGPSAAGLRGIVLDIEGTTTSVAFVYDILFPYARARLHPFLRASANLPVGAEILRRLRDEHGTDASGGQGPPAWIDEPLDARVESAARYAAWLMDQDRKSTALKLLQGEIWRRGYAEGVLRGEVYADVPRALERWGARGLDVRIYSSGSALAQQLLFSTTAHGDLTARLGGYFDTTIGAKAAPESYAAIARAMALPPQAILFISDVARELDAARAAGLQTLLCVRAQQPPAGAAHRVIHSFDEIGE